MKALGDKSKFQVAKEWLFEYIFIIDSNQFSSKYLLMLMTLLELAIFHYFYINPNYSLLQPFTMFQYYFVNIYPYFFHLTPFNDSFYALLTLMVYPIVALFVLFIKHIGPNRILILVVTILVYVFPLLMIKMLI